MQKKTLIWILSISLVLIIGSVILWLIFGTSNEQYPFFYGHMVGGWMMPMGMIGMGLIWFVVLVFFYQMFQTKQNHYQEAMDILKERLARGEISIEEYEQLKKMIKEEHR
ncbi:MAG TPA: SHOCT domain-containing protein [Acholeplasmataceae bacterium]|nr:SHOCT domain-containing protein [Acholeplasmataceae bacterium]